MDVTVGGLPAVQVLFAWVADNGPLVQRVTFAALDDTVHGFTATMPGGTYFLYVKSPTGAGDLHFANGEEASQYLIRDQSVCCVPWDDAGNYLRFSVTYTAATEADEDDLMRETVSRLRGMALRF